MKKYVRNAVFIFVTLVLMNIGGFLGRSDHETFGDWFSCGTLSDWYSYVLKGAHVTVSFWIAFSLVGGYVIIRVNRGLEAYEQRLKRTKTAQLLAAEKRDAKRN